MIMPTTESFESRLMRDFQAAIAQEVTRVKELIIADAAATFEKQVRCGVGTAAINLTNYFSIERMGGNLVITVKIEGMK